MMSGSPMCPSWAVKPPGWVEEMSVHLVNALNCPTMDATELVKCLQEKPTEAFNQAHAEVS